MSQLSGFYSKVRLRYMISWPSLEDGTMLLEIVQATTVLCWIVVPRFTITGRHSPEPLD